MQTECSTDTGDSIDQKRRKFITDAIEDVRRTISDNWAYTQGYRHGMGHMISRMSREEFLRIVDEQA